MTAARLGQVLIVGTGHAGAHAAAALRQRGFEGEVAMIGDEPGLPYERPPLSKDYLKGARSAERMLLRPRAFYRDRRIELLPPGRVTGIDPRARSVALADGRTLAYGALVWAAGASARRLGFPGAELAGVHVLRSMDHADGIRASLGRGGHAVVIGGGYVGLEAASVLAGEGWRVTVLEAADRLLARVAGPAFARFVEVRHRDRGVDVRTGVTVSRLAGDRRVAAVELGDGTALDCDLVVAGIGIEPSTGPLQAKGGGGPYGAPVDADCRTALGDVYAIGDCAIRPNRFSGGRPVRMESVQNAVHQAEVAAASITGTKRPDDPMPLFWSHQFDLRLQTAGLSTGFDEEVVGESGGAIAVTYLRAGVPVAADCANAARALAEARRAIEAGAGAAGVLA